MERNMEIPQKIKARAIVWSRGFPVVQWLSICTSTAGVLVQSLLKELRSCMPHGTGKKKKKEKKDYHLIQQSHSWTCIQRNWNWDLEEITAFLRLLRQYSSWPRKKEFVYINRWINKVWYLHTMEYYLPLKEKEILPFVMSWVNLEDIMLSDINQTPKDKYHMIPFIWGI